MTPEQFVYWLQGFSEINGAAPTAAQWKVIQEHIALVFEKRTPPAQLNLDFAKKEVESPFHKGIEWPGIPRSPIC